MKEITLTISGRVPSKKNSLRRIMRGGRVFTVSSPEYSRWEADAVMHFARQVSGKGIKLPIMDADVYIDITFPDRRRSDLTNKAEGLMDSLVKAGVLKDDNWTVVRRLHLQALGSDPVKAGAMINIRSLE